MDRKKKKIIFITTFVIGMITLVVGVVFLIIGLTRGQAVADGEYLISHGDWVLENSDRVVWDFTEDGKGKLTTNAHENDYDFTWTLTEGKMTVETAWLYDMTNEYDYELDQGAGVLTLSADGTDYKFVASE